MHSARTAPVTRLTIGSFNVHAGVDGWGRPFDVVAACRGLDADVLVLEENWQPEDGPSVARRVADALGYEVFEHAFAGGRLAGPHPDADDRWMRPFDWRGSSHAIFLDSERALGEDVRRSGRYLHARPGHWGVAVLSRLDMEGSGVVGLGRLSRDRARRSVLWVRVRPWGGCVTIFGTHMSHLTYGAPIQFARLARAVRAVAPRGAAALAGDMNLWGPPLGVFFPGWRRAPKARTWPAWRPHSQVDHVLVRGGLRIAGATVLPTAGSDHLPIRVTLVEETPTR
ncbi:MAG: endonuclease/exonuclease/phosphatase family protein [Solirubrobacteraceae bacterium]